MYSGPWMDGSVKSGASIATGPGVFTRTGNDVGAGVSETAAGAGTGVPVGVAVSVAATADEVSDFDTAVAIGGGGVSDFESAPVACAGLASGFDSAPVAVAGGVFDFDSDPAAATAAGVAAPGVAGTGVGAEDGCSASADGAAPTCCPEVKEGPDKLSPHATVSSSNAATKEIAGKTRFFRPKTAPIKPSCNCRGPI